MENDPQLILPNMEMRFGIDAPIAELIVAREDGGTVQAYIGKRVQSFEDQFEMRMPEHG